MGLYNRFCKRFFAAVIIRLTAQSERSTTMQGYHTSPEDMGSLVYNLV